MASAPTLFKTSAADRRTDRSFEPGTIGWTAADLDDPQIEREWFRGRYEIVEGVLAKMPAAYFTGGEATVNLIFVVKSYLRDRGIKGGFAAEADIVIDEARVARADAVYMDASVKKRQEAAARAAGRRDLRRTPQILIPPTVVIESISPGHERHDEQTKLRWYSEFGVPHYWLLNPFDHSLRCLVLRKGRGAKPAAYQIDVEGREDAKVRPSLFPGLVIPLAELWEG